MLKFLQELQEACFLGVAMKSPYDNSGVSSGQTRVPAQEVHNSWSDRWMVLKFLQVFQEACFLGIAMKSPWDACGVSSGRTRVPAQMVHNSWSDRWIVLKILQEFLEAVFLGIALKLLLDTHIVLSGHMKNQTRVSAQEGRNFWSYCWIVLTILQEFDEVCFLGVTMKLPWDAAGD